MDQALLSSSITRREAIRRAAMVVGGVALADGRLQAAPQMGGSKEEGSILGGLGRVLGGNQ